MPAYAELHCLSNFSFLKGASHPEELVRQAHDLGYHALALTDECSVSGIVRAWSAAKECALKFIIGTEIHLCDGPGLVLLALNRSGYGQITRLITTARRACEKGSYRLSRQDLEAAALSDCLALLLANPQWALQQRLEPYTTLLRDAHWLSGLFPARSWLAVQQIRNGRDARHLRQLQRIAHTSAVPLTATGGIRMHQSQRQPLLEVLTAIRLRTRVSLSVKSLAANGEQHLRPMAEIRQLFPEALLEASVQIANHCEFSLDELQYAYPREFVPRGLTAAEHLDQLTRCGMHARWPDGPPEHVQTMVRHELALIHELHYEAYFLTVHDIVSFARSKKILCQGRGSAANSAVCFCLGITEVDPARLDMLFERFISRERNEPPDIDVDFEHERREEVMQYIYRKYGRDHAALTAAVITYKPRSAIRDVGKALGMSLEQVDRLASNVSWWDGSQVSPERVREAGFDPDNPLLRRTIRLVNSLVGFPRHLSQHTGGFVISHDPLWTIVPIENASMPERTVIQWDKDDIDSLGLLKVDCLALGMLSAIRRSFELIAKHRGRRLTMATLPAEDPAVYEMISAADTVGVFQVESRAQMAMLPRLRPANFYDLVIEVAIVRPGPIQGDMVHPYLKRRQGLEPVRYPSEAVQRVLQRTLGVPIFQEQVIQLATVAAGFTPGEADGLRRSMAAWRRRGGLEHYRKKLIEGMQERGYSVEFARRIYQQILGFGEYGFPESHAASFALLVYVSAWLKHHEPAAFTCALLNSQPMGFYAPSQLVQDAQRHGVTVQGVDVLISDWDCTLEKERGDSQPALRLGLRLIKGLSRDAAERLVENRLPLPYQSVQHMAQRAGLNRGDLKALAAAGALSGLTGRNRHMAHWHIAGVASDSSLAAIGPVAEGTPLLRSPTPAEETIADYAHLGLTLGPHPMLLLRQRLNRLGALSSRDIHVKAHGQRAQAAGIVITRQHPQSANNVTFVTLEDETGPVNLVVWGRLAERQRRELLGARLLGAIGEIQKEGEVLHLIAHQLIDYSDLLRELTISARDFR